MEKTTFREIKNTDNEVERDPFLCTCGPCRRYWKETLKGGHGNLTLAREVRSAYTSTLFSQKGILKIGDRVRVYGQHTGTVKFVGLIDVDELAPDTYVGVHLDDNVNSTHNGVFGGKRYFHCPRGHGAMVRYVDVRRLNPPEQRPAVKGNTMFPSFEDIRKRRKQRQERTPDLDFNMEYDRPMSGTSAEFASRQVSASRDRGVTYVFDENDMAYKDAIRRSKLQKKKINTMHCEAEMVHQAQKAAKNYHFNKWKKELGGDDRASKMADTLRKLHLAYEKGEAYENKKASGELSEEEVTNVQTDKASMHSKPQSAVSRHSKTSSHH